MILKNKIKGLFTICLLSFSLIACEKSIDYSGVYSENSKSVNLLILEKLSDNEYKYGWCSRSNTSSCLETGTAELNNNNLFHSFDKSLIGKFDGDKFISNSWGGGVYTKSK